MPQDLDKWKYAILCPDCHGELKWGNEVITCLKCEKEYPIIDEIPVFVKSELLKETDKL